MRKLEHTIKTDARVCVRVYVCVCVCLGGCADESEMHEPEHLLATGARGARVRVCVCGVVQSQRRTS